MDDNHAILASEQVYLNKKHTTRLKLAFYTTANWHMLLLEKATCQPRAES